MSTLFILELVDEPGDHEFTTKKNTNLKFGRARIWKRGNPAGTMKLQVLDTTKTVVIAESNTLLCDYVLEANYVGADDTEINAWIRFDFDDEALRKSVVHNARLLPDAAYFAGRDDDNHLGCVLDYPKPTNDNADISIETVQKSNFSKYPKLSIQIFGRDFGGITQ